jgi:hypothetical protein
MGMYDTIFMECPKCGEMNEEQTKWGPCRLHEYTIDDASPDAIEKFVQDPVKCRSCGKKYIVKMLQRPIYKVVSYNEDDEDEYYD